MDEAEPAVFLDLYFQRSSVSVGIIYMQFLESDDHISQSLLLLMERKDKKDD